MDNRDDLGVGTRARRSLLRVLVIGNSAGVSRVAARMPELRARLLLAAAVLAGCHARPSTPAPVASVARTEEAPPVPAQRWVMRLYSTTNITVPPDRIETFTLEWRGAEATLSFEGDREPVVRFPGRVEDAGGVLTVHLTDRGPWARCTRDTLTVAEPTAMRVMLSTMCDDLYDWQPEAKTKLPVLRCELLDEDAIGPTDHNWERGADLVFAQAPGIEWLHIDDECLKGDGWRAIPADGSIATPR